MALKAPKHPIKLIPSRWAVSGISSAFMTWNSGPGAITFKQTNKQTMVCQIKISNNKEEEKREREREQNVTSKAKHSHLQCRRLRWYEWSPLESRPSHEPLSCRPQWRGGAPPYSRIWASTVIILLPLLLHHGNTKDLLLRKGQGPATLTCSLMSWKAQCWENLGARTSIHPCSWSWRRWHRKISDLWQIDLKISLRSQRLWAAPPNPSWWWPTLCIQTMKSWMGGWRCPDPIYWQLLVYHLGIIKRISGTLDRFHGWIWL